MAFHTVRHGGGPFLPDDGPLRYWTMTNRALDVSLLIMHLVREIYEPRKFVDPHPGNRFPIAGEGREGLDRGAVLFDRVVAAHTERRARQSGQVSWSGDSMAAQAGQSCRRMHFVVEGDRLRGRRFRGRLRPGCGRRPSQACEQLPDHEGRAKATKSPGLYCATWFISAVD